MTVVSGQTERKYERSDAIEVFKNGNKLSLAWSGGFQNPQTSSADFNNDGIEDLMIFDRSDSKFSVLLRQEENGQYIFHNEWTIADKIPNNYGWALLRDYNCDGVKDLFLPVGSAISVHRGYYDDENELDFDLVIEELMTSTGEPMIFSANALPGIEDMDNDGDLDIMDFQPNGNFMFKYENFATQCGEFIFEVSDSCWGNFIENGLSKDALLDTSCNEMGKSPYEVEVEAEAEDWNYVEELRDGVHSGSTTLPLDLDGDGDKDLLLGNLNFDHILYMENGGSIEAPFISYQDPNFPIYDESVQLKKFPASFYEDIDYDGIRDLVLSSFNVNAMDPFANSWYFKNVGSESDVVFELQSKTLYAEMSMDVSWYARPAFFDYNGDGLKDLIISNRKNDEFSLDAVSNLVLYENIGSEMEPKFDLVDTDYLGLIELGMLDVTVGVGDVNSDGVDDIMLGMFGFNEFGGDFNGILMYYENQSGANETAVFAEPVVKYQNIDVGQYSAPSFFDVNGDERDDLIIGNVSGRLWYYENLGTEADSIFELKSSNWGKVAVGPNLFEGYSTPCIIEYPDEEGLYLLVGSKDGNIAEYFIDSEGIEIDSFRLLSNSLSGIDVGEYSSIAAEDLNGDGFAEIVVGTKRGGLELYQYNDEIMPVAENNIANQAEILVYPNPADQFIYLSHLNNMGIGDKELEIYSPNGALVLKEKLVASVNFAKIDVQSISNGIYYLKVTENMSNFNIKILIQH